MKVSKGHTTDRNSESYLNKSRILNCTLFEVPSTSVKRRENRRKNTIIEIPNWDDVLLQKVIYVKISFMLFEHTRKSTTGECPRTQVSKAIYF
jgi:hypothetical protein